MSIKTLAVCIIVVLIFIIYLLISFPQDNDILKEESYKTEINRLKILLENDPKDADNRFRLGKLYFDQGFYKEAIQTLLGVLDTEPRHFEALALLGRISFKLGNKKQAAWFWRSALDADPDNEIIQSLLISLSSSKQKKNLRKNKNDSAWLKHYLSGDKYYRKGQYRKAEEEVKQAIHLNPNDSRSYFLLGVIYRNLNNIEKMVESWKKARELNPSDSMFNELLIYAENNLKKIKDIEKLLDGLKNNPDNWRMRIELANLYLASGGKKYYSEAIKQLKEVIRITPDYYNSYKLVASAYEKIEDYEQAVAYYEKYMQNGGDEKWVSGRVSALKEYQKLVARSQKILSKEGAEDKIILVPEGEFIRGAPYAKAGGGVDEGPPATIYLADFYIDQYEVSHRQYKRFIDAAGYKAPVYWKERRYPLGKDVFPVAYVSWYDAVSYCSWAGKRLPTEEEWEKAARGTDARRYPWGEEFNMANANTGSSTLLMPTPIGSYPSGVSPYGLFDMAGNVQEWTADWYKGYPGSTLQRKAFGEKYKVIRGGSFLSDPLENARTSARGAKLPTKIHRTIGFRCAEDKKE